MSGGEQRLADLERRVARLGEELAVQQELVSLLLDLRRGIPPAPHVQRPVRHLQVVGGAQ